ncbi:MAG: hypothetical protein IKE59_02750, partial [Erysipelotrichaceae bacterium]|nr:hypothetical protein [Erysipelotrichaceae bacterium]
MKEVLTSGDLKDGAFMGYTLTLDNTAPVIESATFDAEAKTVTVTLKDNQYVAVLMLLDTAGVTTYGSALPEQTAA